MAGHGPVGGLGGPVADHQHGHDEAGLGLPLLAPGASGAERGGDLAAQLAAALDVRGLVDGLVTQAYLRAGAGRLAGGLAYGSRDWLTSGLLRVEVTDSGGGTPVARPLPDAASLHGRGLFIVGKLSDAWGSSPPGPATSVWFTVTLNTAAGSAVSQPASTEARPPADKPVSPPAPWRTGPRTGLPQHGRRISPNDLPASRELAQSARPATRGRGQTTRMTESELTLGWLPAS